MWQWCIDVPTESLLVEELDSYTNIAADKTAIENEHLMNEDAEKLLHENDSTSASECMLCINSTQHACRMCGNKICILFCSVPDPESNNDMHVIDKDSTKCVSTF